MIVFVPLPTLRCLVRVGDCGHLICALYISLNETTFMHAHGALAFSYQ